VDTATATQPTAGISAAACGVARNGSFVTGQSRSYLVGRAAAGGAASAQV
jgi:hypothetical protein